jgi:hypothetical protein
VIAKKKHRMGSNAIYHLTETRRYQARPGHSGGRSPRTSNGIGSNLRTWRLLM